MEAFLSPSAIPRRNFSFFTSSTSPTSTSHPFSQTLCATPSPTKPPTETTPLLPSYNLSPTPHLSASIPDLPSFPSPLLQQRRRNTFVEPGELILADIILPHSKPLDAYFLAGPRQTVVFPPGVRAVIVSCGGICPGINTVIRELTMCLLRYGASSIFGVRNGYRGFYSHNWVELTEETVKNIHKEGGTILGSSRGGFDSMKIVDAVETRKIDQLYVIGGDGTIMGCNKIYNEITRRGLKCAVVSIPKTIDNDIAVIDRSFGFETAVDEAQRAINAAYVEANSFPDCVGIVKLMGRNSGFIACHAAYSSREVDICLVPEELFVLRGPGGVLEHMERILDSRGSCVLVVAEGAGHEVYGNVDIGLYIVNETKRFFNDKNREINAKYLDPTYQIRAIPTTTHDNMLCVLISHAAVHGAYAGFTGYSAGPVNGKIALIPLQNLSGIQKKLDTSGSMWQRLRMSTGQPNWIISDDSRKQIEKRRA